MVFSLFVTFSKAHSKTTQDTTQVIVSRMALEPKMTPDMINAGISAIMTSSMILDVVVLSSTWGEEETISVP
jgi:hypothetical protein